MQYAGLHEQDANIVDSNGYFKNPARRKRFQIIPENMAAWGMDTEDIVGVQKLAHKVDIG